jgi:type II secretory ATPase GspE/PulE/Tfp pilus assembly ATPase PilB-like protein
MGIEPFLIASTVRAVVAQRLVRRLVPESFDSYTPDDATVQRVQAAFGIKGAEGMQAVHKLELQAIEADVGRLEGVMFADGPSTSDTTITKMWRMKGTNNNESYRSRMGIYEVLPMVTEIQRLIVRSTTSEVLQDEAIKQGMVTMQTDGLIKSLRGLTTLEEVMRVTSER